MLANDVPTWVDRRTRYETCGKAVLARDSSVPGLTGRLVRPGAPVSPKNRKRVSATKNLDVLLRVSYDHQPRIRTMVTRFVLEQWDLCLRRTIHGDRSDGSGLIPARFRYLEVAHVAQIEQLQ